MIKNIFCIRIQSTIALWTTGYHGQPIRGPDSVPEKKLHGQVSANVVMHSSSSSNTKTKNTFANLT